MSETSRPSIEITQTLEQRIRFEGKPTKLIRFGSLTADHYNNSKDLNVTSRPMLSRYQLSRQTSFDEGGENSPPVAKNKSSMEVSRTSSFPSSDKQRLPNPQSSMDDSSTLPSKPVSAEVRQLLKEYLLSRMSKDTKSDGSSSIDSSSSYQTHLHSQSSCHEISDTPHPRRRNFPSNSLDNETSRHGDGQKPQSPSLPRKKAAYNRNSAMSLDSYKSSSREIDFTTNNNSVWHEMKPSLNKDERRFRRQFSANLPRTHYSHRTEKIPSFSIRRESPPRNSVTMTTEEAPLDLTRAILSSAEFPDQLASQLTYQKLLELKLDQTRQPVLKRPYENKCTNISDSPESPVSTMSPSPQFVVSNSRGHPQTGADHICHGNLTSATICMPPARKVPSQQQAPLTICAGGVASSTRCVTDLLSSTRNHGATGTQNPSILETQQNLANLRLNSPPIHLIHTRDSFDSVPKSPDPDKNNFFLGSLETAYNEFLRLWLDVPTTDWKSPPPVDECTSDSSRTALLFDPGMLSHFCICANGNNPLVHAECPFRIKSILAQIAQSRMQIPRCLFVKRQAGDDAPQMGTLSSESLPLVFYCRRMRGRMMNRDELSVFHTPEHVTRFASDDIPASSESSSFLSTLACGGFGVDSDTVWNSQTTSKAARLAAGQVMCLAYSLARKHIRNGFALVHPPGHHAEPGQAMGFCYFNSIAVAAVSLLRDGLAKRVLILDWDIHHGNGTHLATGVHPGLLYMSLHRHDNGTFFPGTGAIYDTAPCTETRGYVVNVAWGDDHGFSCQQNPPCMDEPMSDISSSSGRDCWKNVANRHCSANKFPLVIGDHNNASEDSGVQLLRDDSWSSQVSSSFKTSLLDDTHVVISSSSETSSLSEFSSTSSQASSPPPNPLTDSQRVHTSLGDAEYLAAMRCIVLPMASEWNPDVVLVSAGFDGAYGHDNALGGYKLSPGVFAWMTRQCMSLANGRVGLVLEGGYVATSTSDCVTACLNSLLMPNPSSAAWTPDVDPLARLETIRDCLETGDAWIDRAELLRAPLSEAIKTINAVAKFHAKRRSWKCLQRLHRRDIALSFEMALKHERARLLGQFPESR